MMTSSLTTGHYEGRDLEAMSRARNYHQWIFEEFEPYLGRFIVEVGAGQGHFSELLLLGPTERLIAVEPSENQAAVASNRFCADGRVEVVCSYFATLAPGLSSEVHAAVYVNVLEHIEDDRSELATVYDALRPGGHVCIFVPALPWLYSRFDAAVGHYRRYRRSGLSDLVRSSGFEIVKLKYVDLFGILPWYVAYKLAEVDLASSHVDLYDRFVPWLRRFERVVPAPIGKNLLIVGRKEIVS